MNFITNSFVFYFSMSVARYLLILTFLNLIVNTFLKNFQYFFHLVFLMCFWYFQVHIYNSISNWLCQYFFGFFIFIFVAFLVLNTKKASKRKLSPEEFHSPSSYIQLLYIKTTFALVLLLVFTEFSPTLYKVRDAKNWCCGCCPDCSRRGLLAKWC